MKKRHYFSGHGNLLKNGFQSVSVIKIIRDFLAKSLFYRLLHRLYHIQFNAIISIVLMIILLHLVIDSMHW